MFMKRNATTNTTHINVKMTLFDTVFLHPSKRLFFRQYNFSKFLYKKFHLKNRNERKVTMEISNVPPIIATYRLALHTFNDKHKQNIATNLSKLKTMMDNLRAEDLGLDQNLFDQDTWKRPDKAPCTYIEVYQDNLVNMSIFVLKPGFKMPLHDHPQMHGLLKVLSGAVKIRSFTEFPLREAINVIDFQTRARHEAARLAQGLHRRRRLFAEVSQIKVCRANSETCTLTPTISNYHEIEALDYPAAFFDILSPPYDTLIDNVGPRRCRYYSVANEISTNLVELQETEVPKCFFCDQAPYLGPLLV